MPLIPQNGLKKEKEIKAAIDQQLQSNLQLANGAWKERIQESEAGYRAKFKKGLSDTQKATLASSYEQAKIILQAKGQSLESIQSAAENPGDVSNPVSFLFGLMSVLIPMFPYNEAAGVQTMSSKQSPVYFLNMVASDTRNGIASGTNLMGATYWENNNNYSSNLASAAATITATVGPFTMNLISPQINMVNNQYVTPGVSTPNSPFLPGQVTIQYNSYQLTDNGQGGFPAAPWLASASVNYTTGVVIVTLAAAASLDDVLQVVGFWDLDQVTPAGITFQWDTLTMYAQPRRVRASYKLDDYYAAKKMLQDYDIDAIMSSGLAGFLNKEISGGVFNNMMGLPQDVVSWSLTLPSGVSWAFQRLSILQPIVQMSNTIRANIQRGAGNVLVGSTDLFNIIETFGSDLWEPVSYEAEPVGPYVAGTLAKKFKMIKNQDYRHDQSIMVYKRNEFEASYIVGSFIPLYSPDPLTTDDLIARRGYGTSLGQTELLANSTVQLLITA